MHADLLMPGVCRLGAVPEMVQLLSSSTAKARNVAAQTLAKLIAAYPDARSAAVTLPKTTLELSAAHIFCSVQIRLCITQGLPATTALHWQPTSFKQPGTSSNHSVHAQRQCCMAERTVMTVFA